MGDFRVILFAACAVLIVSNFMLYRRYRRRRDQGPSDGAARIVGMIAMALLLTSVFLNSQRAASMLALWGAALFLALETVFRVRILRHSAEGP